MATVKDQIDRLLQIRERRRALAAEDKELVEEWEGLEGQMIAGLDSQGMTRVSSAAGTAVISEQVVPMVEDWDAALAYMRENDMLYLLQRRMATGAYREIVEASGEVPGVKPLTKRSINLRSA